ncbi:hypothetical protein Taro_008438 [Colocasia esculenta]|uniref:Uncharacterized protein n=1 Tax=Colocasia esculenta TaxID=4460 RepID=A0A843U3F5_COLES|nr:hypothetical protein [Colocasia esculenta]
MACNFWRWSKIWKAPFGRQKASSGSVWALFPLGYKEHGECVDTLSHLRKTGLLGTRSSVNTLTGCVDTLSQSGNWVFWNLGLVST